MKELLWEGMLWLDKRDVSFDSDCSITKVQKSMGSGRKWLDEDGRGTTWRATLKSGIFRSMEGSATFYTTMQRKHHGEIQTVKSRLSHGKETIAFHEDSLQGLGPLDGKDAERDTSATASLLTLISPTLLRFTTPRRRSCSSVPEDEFIWIS
ncbi:hypothetical protein FNYG_08142 [Fusarium nygamai]|uniref:Uncharacterized protein n=1 Tax=Gibberella nygamai TaxID=42673 RepID=A0A2K0W8A9_GIBNY|nr:hypothetical protein FNYG_08142 [Fusarium nygamai]